MILKKILQYQAGLFNFKHNRTLSLFGVIGVKNDPLIPFDKDMVGCLIVNDLTSNGVISQLSFKSGNSNSHYFQTNNITATGTIESI